MRSCTTFVLNSLLCLISACMGCTKTVLICSHAKLLSSDSVMGIFRGTLQREIWSV